MVLLSFSRVHFYIDVNSCFCVCVCVCLVDSTCVCISVAYNVFFLNNNTQMLIVYFVGNKAKGRTSKVVFQESKARQNFQKANISYLLIRTRTCAYQVVKNVCFSEILACFTFLKHPF